ncbi:MAG: hypothetical protein C4576_13310 [Desulfobacteraceae bacterium]|nr:MAG: hypothetical protein C4576_13310 [Desulfobacteraceae bacterium]
MRLYGFDSNLNVIELGACDCQAALTTFEQCYSNGLNIYKSAEDAVAATSFGLYQSETDFIEISCNGKDQVTVHSDRLWYPSWFAKTFGLKRHFFIKGDKEKGAEIVRDYFGMERQAFENKFKEALCR